MEESNHYYDQTTDESSHGWQTVTYAKRRNKQRKQQNNKDEPHQNGSLAGDRDGDSNDNVVVEAQRAAEAADITMEQSRSIRHPLGDDLDEDSIEEKRENGVVEEKKKKKKKKVKKPKITVSEAAAKIDPADLESFMAEEAASYESQEDIQLTRLADYFSRAFSGVGAAQFPWVKTFRESTLNKLIEIPLSSIPEPVYKISVDWINQSSVETLESFILQLLDEILAALANQQPSSKSKVAVFVVLEMVLRQKPDALMNVLPMFKDNVKYQGKDELLVILWMISQACEGALPVGLYAWASYLLPILDSRSASKPQSRNLILQLLERILAVPKARTILTTNAIRKGERLISPSALEILMRVTFPAPSARIKATERFEAVYPTLKEIALTGIPGSKAMKQVSQEILNIAIIKAAGESNPALSEEAVAIFVWCLTQNPDCYKQWDKLYLDNLEASVVILRKLSDEWKQMHIDQESRNALKATLKSFHQKNGKALKECNASEQTLLKDAEKLCKILGGRLSSHYGCIKAMVFLVTTAAVGSAVMNPDIGSFDLKSLLARLSSFTSL